MSARISAVAAKIARIFFFGAALVLAIILTRSLLNYYVYLIDNVAIFLAVGMPVLGIFFCLIFGFSKPEIRTSAFMVAISITVPTYGIELYLGSNEPTNVYR